MGVQILLTGELDPSFMKVMSVSQRKMKSSFRWNCTREYVDITGILHGLIAIALERDAGQCTYTESSKPILRNGGSAYKKYCNISEGLYFIILYIIFPEWWISFLFSDYILYSWYYLYLEGSHWK